MPVEQLSLERLRQHALQFMKQVLAQLLRLPFQVPAWPLRAATRSVASWLSWRVVVAAVLLGGVVHICATLAASVAATGQAYQALRETVPVNRMTLLPLQTPAQQILPFLPADALYAMCRYDLKDGPVAVTATVNDAGWALSLHTPRGENFYVLPGQSQRRTELSILVVPTGPDGQPTRHETSSDQEEIASPTNEGLIVLRAPIRGLAWTAETQAMLQRATCTPAKP